MADSNKLIIFDTTLRDGEQSPGASMTKDEKIRIARQLERLKVDVIEAGCAASSPGDFEAIKAIAELRGRITFLLRLGETPMPEAAQLEEWGLGLVQRGNLLLRIEGIAPRLAPLLASVPDLAPLTIAGRPVRAIQKAERRVASNSSGFSTKKSCLALAIMMLKMGASWKASEPMAARETWPQITTIGMESAMQSRTGVTMLVAPGPDVTRQTPTFCEARE